MSETEAAGLAESPRAEYDYYSPVFYQIYGDLPEVMSQVREANAAINRYLQEYGVSDIWRLPADIQRAIHDKATITINLGEEDE